MADPFPTRRAIAPPSAGDLVALSARELVAMTTRGRASCVEVLDAFLRRIEAVDPLVHAICTLDAQVARVAARELDVRPDRAALPLLGLPVVVKDNKHARGLRTTFGSPIHADVVADADGVDVRALREAGAIVVGKANIPELGVGGRTHNPLFGSTFNPLDLDKSPAGSSGGNAAAVAARMTPVTLGSDFGGSIRHPAAFCGLYGLRPTPGLVPQSPGAASWDPFVVTGPIGHDPGDLALMLDAIVPMRFDDARDPLSRLQRVGVDVDADAPFAASSYAAACAVGAQFERSSMADLRVLWCGDAGLPFEAGIVAACAVAMDRLADRGARVDRAPQAAFGAAVEVYDVLRHWNFFLNLGPTVEANAERVSDFIRWDVDEGAHQPAERLRWAWQEQARLFRTLSALLAGGRTVLALPTSQVMPFDAAQARIESVDGVAMPWYYSWQASCCIVTVTTLPAISIPLPVAPGELPIGLQLVGPPHGERLLLAIAESMRVR